MTTGHNQQILVVDDEDELRNLLCRMLAAEGYHISSATNGEEAIDKIQRQSFDLALLDIQMPLMNGIQVLKFIKEKSPSTRAIMLTGYAELKFAMEAREHGARDFISKPFKIDDILTTISRVLAE